MKTNHQASQIVEYLLMFTAVVVVIFGVAQGVAQKAGDILGDSLNGLSEDIYSYDWTPSNCGACSEPVCGDGTQDCSYECQRNDGVTVLDSFCAPSGVKPPPDSMPCNIQPCPIDCQWDPDPAHISWGPCTPSCVETAGDPGTQTGNRAILVEAQYGGAACNPADGVVTRTCAPFACTGFCGDGILTLGESCDTNDLGIYGFGDCDHDKVKALGGENFVEGTISCYPAGTAWQCQIDMSLCEYIKCTPWSDVSSGDEGCGANVGCPDGERKQTKDCQRLRGLDDPPTIMSGWTLTQCVADGSCDFYCTTEDENAILCPGWNQDYTEDNQAWTYLTWDDNCPEFPATCTARCPENSHVLTTETGGCACEGVFEWKDYACVEIAGKSCGPLVIDAGDCGSTMVVRLALDGDVVRADCDPICGGAVGGECINGEWKNLDEKCNEGNVPFTYAWIPVDCGPCSVSCGGGTMTCDYVCQRSDMVIIGADSCLDEVGPRPIESFCNEQPCDCIGDWVEGPCFPECGEDRTRVDTFVITQYAGNGGEECIAEHGYDEIVDCDDLACDSVCGDGNVDAGEQCDGSNFLEKYEPGICNNIEVKKLGSGKDFVGGMISCYDNCQIDVSLCEYESCDEDWDDAGCGVQPCSSVKDMGQTVSCRLVRENGTVVAGSSFTGEQCVVDYPNCNFSCAEQLQADVSATECPGSDQGITEDNYPWEYYNYGNCPFSDDATCSAYCPDYSHIVATDGGCVCEGNWEWDGSECVCESPYEDDGDGNCVCKSDVVLWPSTQVWYVGGREGGQCFEGICWGGIVHDGIYFVNIPEDLRDDNNYSLEVGCGEVYVVNDASSGICYSPNNSGWQTAVVNPWFDVGTESFKITAYDVDDSDREWGLVSVTAVFSCN